MGKVSGSREQLLRRNFRLLYLMKALMNVRILNAVASIFYLSRGLSLEQLYWMAGIWSVVSVAAEVPSSYLADRWGRKNVLGLSVILGFAYWSWLLVAEGPLMLGVAFGLFSLSFAFLSGTDEALLYDTHQELGETSGGLKKLASLEAAQRFFKIFSPALAALAVSTWGNGAFVWLITVDIGAHLLALGCVVSLVEPQVTAPKKLPTTKLLRDAWRLLTTSPFLRRVVLSKNLVFMAALIVWRFQDQYFVSQGLSLLTFGLAWSGVQAALSLGTMYLPQLWTGLSLNARINRMNLINAGLSGLCVLLIVAGVQPFWLLLTYSFNAIAGAVSIPWYQKILHHHSQSANRATTSSLANLLQNTLALPLFALIVVLIPYSESAPWVVAAGLALTTITLLRLPPWEDPV